MKYFANIVLNNFIFLVTINFPVYSNGIDLRMNQSFIQDTSKICDTLFLKSGSYILVQSFEFIDNQVKYIKCEKQDEDSYTLISKNNILFIKPGQVIILTPDQAKANKIPFNPELRSANNISINLGLSSLISLSYERQFLIDPGLFISCNLGIGYNEEFQLCIFGPCSSPPKKYLTIPHHITFNSGKKRNFFEIGIGGTMINGDTKHHYIVYPIFGYRLQPFKSYNGSFRVSVSFPIDFNSTDFLFIPIGLSYGAGF